MKEVRERIPSTRGDLGLTSPQQESEKKIKTISYLYLGKERFSVTLVQWIHTWTGLCGVFFKLCNFSAVGSDSQVWSGRDPERTAQRGAHTVRRLWACPTRTGPAAVGTQVAGSIRPGTGLGVYRPVKRCSCSGWSARGLGEGGGSQSLFPCCLLSPSTRLAQPATGSPGTEV